MRGIRKTYLDEKRKLIEQKDEVIQRIERRERENAEKGLEKQNMQNFQSDFNIQDQFGATDANLNKQKLSDYEEAFRRIHVSFFNKVFMKLTRINIGSNRCLRC